MHVLIRKIETEKMRFETIFFDEVKKKIVDTEFLIEVLVKKAIFQHFNPLL